MLYKPTTQEEARNLSILSQVVNDPTMVGKSQAEVEEFLNKEIKRSFRIFQNLKLQNSIT